MMILIERDVSNVNDKQSVPREEGIDHSVSLLREGYRYILNRRESFQADVFETRLLGQKAICLGGKEAAELFYNNEKFQRQGAAPNRVRETLFGEKGVQTLDGSHHKHRKEMFMSLMTPENLAKLTDLTQKEWAQALKNWKQKEQVVLYEEGKSILCSVACQWAGIRLSREELQERTDALSRLFESPASFGPEHWRGRMSRNKAEKWISNLIGKVREGTYMPERETALHTIAWHRDEDEELLVPEVAAVEVINILRPIVAVAIYVNFLALALHHYPHEKEKLQLNFKAYSPLFIEEVRRYYPFFPFAVARVKKDFTWNNYLFQQGTLTMLDLYGTNHDPKLWNNPSEFNPERFKNRDPSLYDLIPQGGGDYIMGHRCAGEFVTIDIMKVSLDYLVNLIDYDIPDQDLSYSMVAMPSIPKSKVILKNVKPNGL